MSLAVVSDTFATEVLEAQEPVLVDFWATWCAPCRALAPTVEELGRRFEGRLKVVKVDVDGAPDLAARYGVQSIPTVVLFQAGSEAVRLVGARPLAAYEAEVRRLLDR